MIGSTSGCSTSTGNSSTVSEVASAPRVSARSRIRFFDTARGAQHSGQKDLSGWRLSAPTLEQTVVHLVQQHVGAPDFSASLVHTPTMEELASVHRSLDGLCSESNVNGSEVRLLRLIRRVDISPGSMSILLDRDAFAACLSMGPDRIREDTLRIHAPFRTGNSYCMREHSELWQALHPPGSDEPRPPANARKKSQEVPAS